MDISNFTEAIKDTFSYWGKQLIEKTFLVAIIILVIIIILFLNNPYGRYLDSWIS